MTVLRLTNQFVQEQQPWTLKSEADQEKLQWVLSTCFETLRICGILLQPVVPRLSSKLLDKLGICEDQRSWEEAKPSVHKQEGKLNQEKTVLFSKIR